MSSMTTSSDSSTKHKLSVQEKLGVINTMVAA